MSNLKKLSNPFSTGGGGINFERRVQATFLLCLFVKGFSPVLELPIEQIKFQTKRLGWNTDDLLVQTKNGDSKMLCQIKHDLIISEKSKIFQEVINAAWADFNNKQFNKKQDKIALITGLIAKNSIHSFRYLNSVATSSLTYNDFNSKIVQANFSNDSNEKILNILEKCLIKANNNQPISRDELWKFCKSFVLLVFDVDYENSVYEALIKSLIEKNEESSASSVWEKFKDIASNFNEVGGDINAELLKEKLKYFIDTADNKELSFIPFDFTLDDFWANLAILGAWDENNEFDKKFISDLFEISYTDFERKIHNYLSTDNKFISYSNGIFKVNYRKQIFKNCNCFYFEKSVEKYFTLACAAFLQIVKTPKNEILSSPLNNISFNHSVILRRGLSQGLAILSNTPYLKNCSTEKLNLERNKFINNIFKSNDCLPGFSLNNLVPIICEISPKAYLNSLENYINNNSQNTSLWKNTNFIYNIVWSVETLAWHSEYIIDSIRCLAELASLSREESSDLSKIPLDAIASILSPGYPQTLAPIEKHKNSITLLVREYPQLAWTILKKLLPPSHFISFGTSRPKFLDISVPDKINVKPEHLAELNKFCCSLALEISFNDSNNITELVNYLICFDIQTLNSFFEKVKTLSSAWTDEQKTNLWISLNNLKFRELDFYNAIIDKNEFFTILDNIINILAPIDCYYKNRRLFLSEFDEFFPHANIEEGWHKKEAQKLENIKEIYATYGLDSVYKFGYAINKTDEVFYKFGRFAKEETIREIINKYDDFEFINIVVSGFISKNGVLALEKVGLENHDTDFIIKILSHIYLSSDLLKLVNTLVPHNINLFWQKVTLPVCYEPSCGLDISYIVENLIDVNRFSETVNMLGKSFKDFPLPEEKIYFLLNKAAEQNDTIKLDIYAVQRLIKRLQDSDDRDIEKLSDIEFLFLPWLDSHSRTQPRALKTKISNSPQFFCQLIELAYKKHNSKTHKSINKSLGERLFQILFHFDVVPGLDWDGNFNFETFKNWIDYVINWSVENDREIVTKQTIGNGLSFAKLDINGIINENIIKILDAKENKPIRDGYKIGIFNQRGVYCVDPEGKPEKELSAKYKKLSIKVENLGYSRFSKTLLEISQDYIDEAEQNIKESKWLSSDDEDE